MVSLRNAKNTGCVDLIGLYMALSSLLDLYIQFHNAIIFYNFTIIDKDYYVYIKRSKD